MKKNPVQLIYQIALSVMLAVAGICLIVACVGIYLSGDRPFSPEAVGAAFSQIAIPVYLCLALMVAGLFVNMPEGKKAAPEKQYAAILSRLQEKLSPADCPEDTRRQLEKLQRSRKLHRNIGFGLLAAGSILFLSYGMNGQNFDQIDITGSMAKAMYWFIPCLAVPFGYGVFTAFFSRRAMEQEIALLKDAIAQGHKSEATPKACACCTRKAWNSVRFTLLLVAIVILIYGFLAGGTNDVLTKAINICTECVGLG